MIKLGFYRKLTEIQFISGYASTGIAELQYLGTLDYNRRRRTSEKDEGVFSFMGTLMCSSVPKYIGDHFDPSG